MLSFFNPRFLTLSNLSKSYLFLFLLSLLISLSSPQDSTCTEQWSEIILDRDQWTRVGDVNDDNDKSSPLVFEFAQKDTSETDIGGAVWHSYDFSKKRGILISFRPTIKHDESYFGNVKYPQGFAIVFTSSSIENLIGEKGPGLGYEGIMNAIAFEFDFVKQSTYGDAKKPHFSVNYNIKGAISASTKERTDNAINIILPNFYDNSLDGYVKNIIFEIEIIGNKLTVRSNREGYKELLSTNLPEFQKLLEQEDVHIGITASMNQNKKVSIENFKVSEVSMNEKGNLEIQGSDTIPTVKAGEEVALLYSIKSTCGEKLKIYSDEYSGDDLKLIINNEEVKPEVFSFNEDTVQLKMVVTETIENIYTALVYFKGQSSIPAKFIVTSGDIDRLELCDPDEEKKYYLSPGFEQTKNYFYVLLCFYDQYGNRKQATRIDMANNIGFPNNLKPATPIESYTDEAKEKLVVKIPFNTFGEYKIFSREFIESKVRYINVMPKSISPEKSEISILYDQNIIESESSVVSLRIKPKDNYGRDIPSVILKKMGCSFGSSFASTEDNSNVKPVTEDFKDDYVLLSVTNIEQSGRYIFTPRVKCDEMEMINLECGIDFETKLNNCEFYKPMTQISTNHISIFDEYLGEYTIYESGENNNYLYISLDEKDSTKLTEVILLDSSDSPYLNIPSKVVSANLGGENLIVNQIGNKYVLILPNGKKRENYTPITTYDLEVKFDSATFNLKIKFYFLDPYMTNTDTSEASGSRKISYRAFYKQNSFKLEASDTLLLFDVYEQIDNKFLGTGANLDTTNIQLSINNQQAKTKKIEKHSSFISVTSNELSKVGNYNIKLYYDTVSLADINIEIIPKKEANYLFYENGDIVNNIKNIEIGKNEHIKLIMADKYENLIQNNEIYNAFSKIKISQHDIFDISLDYSGKIHIINQGKTGKMVTLILPNGKKYNIESTYSPRFNDTDPLNSYGLIINSPIITKDEEIEMGLYLRDQFGNIIASSDIDKSVINIYIEGTNTKKIIPMSLEDNISSDNRYKFKASLEKNGDYEIKIFINNIPVECKTCHFRKNYESSAEATKATIYILGNKQKIPVSNSKEKTNYNVGLVDKTTGYFSFYLEERDKYNNEYRETKSLTFSFEADDKNTDVTSITICPSGSNEDERNFFKLCSGVSDNWKKLPNGIYRIMTLSDTLVFTLYLTDSFIDSSDSTPDIKYSSILLNTNEIYGKTDLPGSFILDLRNKNYKRIQNIDISKITINEKSNSLKYEIAKGPEKGLLTVFLLAQMPGEYEFTVNYDNNKIVDNTYTYYCACGFDKKLKYVANERHSNGNYAFFQILDSNDNNCTLQYNWNDLSLKEYANNVFSATDSKNKNKYKFETYYNIMSNTFIFYFDNHVPDNLTLSSTLFKLEDATELNLMSNILDENHFRVEYSKELLKIIPLNANYESEDIKFDLNTSDFDVSLIRIINDDFQVIKNDFGIPDDLTVSIDDSLIDAKGKYIYVVYYKGKELFCQNCIIDKTENNIDLAKTKVYQKEGDNNYIPNDPSLIMPMMKSNYPFFKINLFSANDNLVILDSINSLSIKLETLSGNEISSQTKWNKNGNIYIYLTKDGRETYINLEPMTTIKLKLTYSGATYEASYYVFDYHQKTKNSKEYCSIGAIPEIINKQETYIKRHDEDLELEIYLSGCDEEHNEIKKLLKIKNKETGKTYDASLIPTDIIGGYILFLPTSIEVSDENYYYIINDKAKSELFKLSVIPDYEVKKVSFIKDENMDETQTDKLYTYVLVELKDEHNNIITNEGRNLFINDLNILELDNDLPYRLTYDQNKKAFRCQVPINGFGKFNIQTVSSIEQPVTFQVEIGPPKLILNSLFRLESEGSNTFSFFIELVDEFYKDINKDSIPFEYQISFKYFTINPLTEEVFITDIEHKIENQKYIINLKDSYPKYSIYGFIPYIGFLPQICPECIILNENPDYIYSIEKDRYIPHNLEKNLFLIKDEDYPIYLYLAHKTTTIEPSNANYKEIISTEKSKLYLITYNDGSDQIQVKFNSKTFSARFIDYSPQVEIENRAIPPYIENYGFKVNTKNNLDNIHIGFFMENRDSNGKLIITQPNLVIDDKFTGIIKRINVINTCYTGIYYIKITFSKSANIEFYPKFNTNHKNDVNSITMQLKAIGAFPTDIVLNNKEIINKNVIKFNLVTSNSNSEQTCDERLNIYIDDLNLKNFKKMLAQEGEDCSLYIKFTGETIIKSNINNFISDINNNDRTLYNINPLFSKLAVTPNIIDSTEESLSIKFQEKTSSGVSYVEDEVNDNKNLYIYKYISPNKIKLIKTYSGLFSSDYLISPYQLNLERGFTYILIGDIIDNNMPPSFVHYKKKTASNTDEVKSIEAYYFNEDKKSNILSNFYDKMTSEESFELNLPMLLKIKLLDSAGNPIDVVYNEQLTTELILADRDSVIFSIDLISQHYNDDTFLIKPKLDSISDLLHLPLYVEAGQYYIHISYKENNFYSLISLKKTDLQYVAFKNKYHYPNTEISLDSFDVKIYENDDKVYISKDIPLIQQICLKKDDKIINKHLDWHKLSLTGCSDINYAISYMGCFAFTAKSCQSEALTVAYDGKSASTGLTIRSFSSSDITMSLTEIPKEKEQNQAMDLVFGQNIEINNYDLFKIFINGERLEKTDYSIVYSMPQVIFTIKSYEFTSIPKIKKLMVTYEKGDSSKKNLIPENTQIEIKQTEYDPTTKIYSLIIQEPFDINVGEKIYFYILLYDQHSACYYGDFDKLKNMEVTLKTEEKDYTAYIMNLTEIEGYSQCEYVYRVDFEETLQVAGYFDLEIKDNELKGSSNLYIAPKDIDPEKSYFEGNTAFKALETFFLNFTGTDSEGNSINYYDLIKEFDIQLKDSSGEYVKKDGDNFDYNIRVNEANTTLNISMKLKLTGTYTLEALFRGEKMNLQGEFKITIEYGECSTKYPFLEIMRIDQRNETFIGETVSIGIICKDAIGNVVEKAGDEIFTANIRQIVNNVTEIKYDYKKDFKDGRHLIYFTPSQIGNYMIDISLNGKIYGETQMVEVIPINKTKYTCMNKKQFDNIIDCDGEEPTYRDFLREILTDSFMCYDTKETGFLYKCSSSDENCVSNTVDCDCLGSNEKWNGYCYSSAVNPIESVKNNKAKVTCKNKLKAKNPLAEIYECGDGSCRFRPEECNTAFECPLGYRSCGNKCILLNEPSCAIQDSCSSDQVLCWDLSCAKNYDLCPTRITCPAGKVLCPDGSCQLTGHCLQPATRTCSSGQYQCPDFTCVANKDDCKKNPVCEVGLSLCENGLCQKSCQEVSEPEDKYRCPNGKYVENSKLCPSDIFVPDGYVKCPSGGIAKDNDACQYVQGGLSITCPNTKPILCPDLSCVSKSSECNLYNSETDFIPKCPPHKPYQCWNNECRKSFDECPTPVTCPAESPVLCQNGFCVKSSDECVEKSEEKCSSKYRCFEGTCVASMELCPTHTYCGKDQIKCWNGACVNDISECRSTILESCSETFPYRCPDGSCRTNYQDCSSISTCPPNLPIKCFDNSCRASINECPAYQTCGENKVSCPDGTCALSYDECNTVVTCISGSPYLCYDNTCKAQLSDCPEPPKCSKNEVLCPNGACVSSRQNCKIFDPCESIYPIRCDSNSCSDNLDKCSSSRKKRCPEGYVFCANGECKASEYLCESFECPKNKPIKCREGVCVHDAKLCDIEANGCPYNKPNKCADGTCVKDKNSCVKDYTCSNPSDKLCPDGSCIDVNEECPMENGCYKDRPLKCADGTCINPSTTSCTPVLCPFDRPFKCPNGYCVSKSSDCSNDLFEKDLVDCDDGLIMCADGRCVESTDYCRPMHECENSYTKCKDGSCRVSPELCPKDIQCPESRPYPCANYCAKSQEECNGLICPEGYIKCEKDGICKPKSEYCTQILNKGDICAEDNKHLCKNGRCIALNVDCSLVSDACPDDDYPYLCPNGECTDSLSNCHNIENEGICETGKVMCPSGRCVENKKEILATQCTNNIGCPLDKPYRCSNGNCVQSERNCNVTSILEGGGFKVNIMCDPSKPYLCGDKTCVSDTKFCKPSLDCPSRCGNGYCPIQGESCSQFSGLCPTANPIHCPNGNCVDDIVKCGTTFNIPTCSEGEFYCVRLNKCLKNKLDCFIFLESAIEKVENNVRLLHENVENIVNPLNDKDFIELHKGNNNKIISLKEEDDDPEKDEIKIEGTICYDGTIATGNEKCPIVPACKIGQYRCENGACASDKSLCPVDENYICVPGQKKCPDGLCHKDCSEVAFHGCEVNKYQCSNGQCLDDKYDCIGHSMCPDPTFPFRCMSGQCKSDPEECEVVERLGTVKKLTYTFNKLNKIAFNFAFDSNGHNVGRIEIPGNGLKLNDNYSNIELEEVSSSMLKDPDLYNNSAEFLFNVSNSISGSEGVLDFENSVMSPVFKFYSKNKDISFKFAGKIDIAHNEYQDTSLYYYDYCLAKLKGFDLDTGKIKDDKDKGWECVERQTKEGQTEFKISEFGVYAVILNPLRNKVNYLGDSTAKNFFVENVKIILIVLAIIIVVIALVFYIFLRVTRYRKKYHENREKILLMKQQREEYENMTTDIFGQTLGDNINGIVYKSNPAYTVTDEIKKSGTSLEDEIEKLQIECKNVTEQNERLQKDIDEITKKYEQLSENIENMNK